MQRSVFRDKAVRDYLKSSKVAVLPRSVLPSNLALLWIVLGVLALTACGAAYAIKVPVYASGSAVLPEGYTGNRGATEDAEVTVLLPPKYLSSLRIGQQVALRSDATDGRMSASIVAVEPEIAGPDAVQRLLSPGGTASSFTQPLAVAVARIDTMPNDAVVAPSPSGIYRADVEIDSNRAISFLPLVGQRSGDVR